MREHQLAHVEKPKVDKDQIDLLSCQGFEFHLKTEYKATVASINLNRPIYNRDYGREKCETGRQRVEKGHKGNQVV